MFKKGLTFLIPALCTLCLVAGAQALYSVPESNPDGRVMTIRDSQTSKFRPGQEKHEWQVPERFFSEGGSLWMDTGAAPALLVRGGDGIVCGETVSRNEFGIDGGIFPCPSDSCLVAFYRKDESAVTEFPLLDITTRTGSLHSIRYPMNGMTSERVDVCVLDTRTGGVVTLRCDDFGPDRYMAGVSWMGTEEILVQVLDRSQHHLRLNRYRASDGRSLGTVLTEDNDAWVEPRCGVTFFEGSPLFVYTTDNRDGYSSLYLCDTLGTVRPLVCPGADVHLQAVIGDFVYYTSAEVSPVENHLFKLQVTRRKSAAKARIGKPVRLTAERGWHAVTFAPDGYWRDTFSNFETPGWTRDFDTDGKMIRSLAENDSDPLASCARCEVEFGTVPSADGLFDNYYRFIKPLGYDPAKSYPLIVYVYGGPHSQMVKDSWLGGIRMWEMAMAQRGYAVYVQDNRGTSNRGAAFEKAINRRCGQAEMQDQMAGLQALLDRTPWIDRGRIGVHGWSYGGFMTISLLTNYPSIFKVAVAGGPVIDWRWYEIMYGERYMDTYETNPEGFELTSLMNRTSDVKGKLLICQGAIDETVVWQHSLNFVQKCIEEGVQLDYFPYPCDKHNMRGKARFHLYEKITDYFINNL